MLWDLNEGKHLYSLEAGDTINALVFSPNRYWLCAATASAIKIFDLESKVRHFLSVWDRWRRAEFVPDVSSRSWMSSSPTSSRLARSLATPSARRSRGPPMDRLSSLGASPSPSSSYSSSRS